MQIDDAEPSAWSPWVAVPPVQGRFAARAWVKLTHGQIGGMTLDAVIRGLDMPLPNQAGSLTAQQVHLRMAGMPGDLGLLSGEALPLPLATFCGLVPVGHADALAGTLDDVVVGEGDFDEPLDLVCAPPPAAGCFLLLPPSSTTVTTIAAISTTVIATERMRIVFRRRSSRIRRLRS